MIFRANYLCLRLLLAGFKAKSAFAKASQGRQGGGRSSGQRSSETTD